MTTSVVEEIIKGIQKGGQGAYGAYLYGQEKEAKKLKEKRETWKGLLNTLNKDKQLISPQDMQVYKTMAYENLYGVKLDAPIEAYRRDYFGDQLTKDQLVYVYKQINPAASAKNTATFVNTFSEGSDKVQKEAIRTIEKRMKSANKKNVSENVRTFQKDRIIEAKNLAKRMQKDLLIQLGDEPTNALLKAEAYSPSQREIDVYYKAAGAFLKGDQETYNAEIERIRENKYSTETGTARKVTDQIKKYIGQKKSDRFIKKQLRKQKVENYKLYITELPTLRAEVDQQILETIAQLEREGQSKEEINKLLRSAGFSEYVR